MRTRAIVLTAALALCGLIFFLRALPGSSARQLAPDTQEQNWQIVHITFRDLADLNRLTEQLDIWEVRHQNRSVVARVTRAESEWLLAEGYSVATHTPLWQVNAPPGYPCYHTINELYADQDTYATTYPTLTQVITIGWSYEGRPLRVLKLTSPNNVADWPKPRFFLIANIHGREFITPETAMQFVWRLLEGYGSDPTPTWLLDWREIYVLVSANPDGHVKNEASWAWWRKNAHTNSCPTTYGTDLNRNSSFQWGGAGTSTNSCSEIYRGDTPASESETQALENYVASLFPDQRGPDLSDAAPMTTTGILITLHSYSDLVLWPWGFTYTSSPNEAQLAQLGEKLASYNGYTPQPASALYPASGTTDDWSYGELGIASYTFEMGSSSDGFLPSCDRYDALVQPNLGALFYAARVARAPYQNSPGPDTISLITASTTSTVHFTATIASERVISAAEPYLDTPPWAGSTPLKMEAVNGVFDQPSQVVSATLPLAPLSRQPHIAFVRGQDTSGNWGPVAFAMFDGPSFQHSTFLPVIARGP